MGGGEGIGVWGTMQAGELLHPPVIVGRWGKGMGEGRLCGESYYILL